MRLFDTRQAKIGVAQFLRLAELCPRTFGIAFERVTGREIGMDEREPRIFAVRLF